MKLFLIKVLVSLCILKPFHGTADVIVRNASAAAESGGSENSGTIGHGGGTERCGH